MRAISVYSVVSTIYIFHMEILNKIIESVDFYAKKNKSNSCVLEKQAEDS